MHKHRRTAREETAMLYVERNDQGEIIAVRKSQNLPQDEFKPAIDGEIIDFLGKNSPKDSIFHLLASMDMEIIRILEDLIDLLVGKNLIMFSELPQKAQEKLLCRKQIRNHISKNAIIFDDSDIL